LTVLGPTLTSARLTLRPPQLGDEAHLLALVTPDETRRFLGPFKPTRSDSFARHVRNAGGWALFGYSNFMVFETATGDFVGSMGVFKFDRDLGAHFDGCPEAGWIIALEKAGQGYATEGMAAILDWFDRAHGRQRTVCVISPENTASHRVAAKLSYVKFGESQLEDEAVDLLERF
jgi:RimJ/RimL family protein N-acetyltransferase